MKEGGWHEGLTARILLGSVIPLLLAAGWWAGVRSGSAVVPGFGAVADVLLHPFREPPDLYSRSLAFSILMTGIRFALGYFLSQLFRSVIAVVSADLVEEMALEASTLGFLTRSP